MEKHRENMLAEIKYAELRDKYGLNVVGSRIDNNKKLVFARGRRIDNDDLTPSKNMFGYPPDHACTKMGRANYKYHPVMYVGESPKVIADELDIKDNEMFLIAIYFTPKPVEFEFVLLLSEDIVDINPWKQIMIGLKGYILSLDPSNLPEPAEILWNKIQKAASLFRVNDYSETAAIAHNWIYKNNLHAIIYPSVKSNEYCNFALNPAFVDSHLKFHCVLLCKMKKDGLELHKIGFEVNNEITWRGISLQDANEFDNGYMNLIS